MQPRHRDLISLVQRVVRFGPPRQRHQRAISRTPAIDWLRGIAMLLVLLSHGWALWSTAALEKVPPLLHVVQSGNLAVSVFLVVGGFLLTRSLIGAGTADDDTGRVGRVDAARPGFAILTRVVRVSAQVYVLCAAILVLALVDPLETLTFEQTWATVAAVGTYTWNWYLQTSSPVARPDLGHLWYTSVYIQVTVLLVVLVRSLRHRRVVLIAVVVALVMACTAWRAHVADSEIFYVALLRTTTRMDGMLWGALLALAWPWLHRARTYAPTIAGWSLLGLLGLTLALGNSMAYLGWGGVGINLCLVGFIFAAPHLATQAGWNRTTSWYPLVRLGQLSLAVFVWHYPVFFAVARHGGDWPGPVKVLASGVIVTAAVILTTRFVEAPAALAIDRLRTRGRSTADSDDKVGAR